jgi:hypothetical protein
MRQASLHNNKNEQCQKSGEGRRGPLPHDEAQNADAFHTEYHECTSAREQSRVCLDTCRKAMFRATRRGRQRSNVSFGVRPGQQDFSPVRIDRKARESKNVTFQFFHSTSLRASMAAVSPLAGSVSRSATTLGRRSPMARLARPSRASSTRRAVFWVRRRMLENLPVFRRC